MNPKLKALVALAAIVAGTLALDLRDGLEDSYAYRAFAEPVVTLEQFKRIAKGMTYAEVVEIIGAGGELIAGLGEEDPPSSDSKFTVSTYRWSNGRSTPWSSRVGQISCAFTNGALVSFSQLGL